MVEETFEDVLERNRVEIVQCLQLDRTFLFDYLRSKAVFDIGDCDLVHAERTREQKAGKLLDILMTKGNEGYSHFVDAIQLLNPHLFEKITGEKATARPSPLMIGRENFFLGSNGRAPDLDIMRNHLVRITTDLQDLTIRYDTVLKENETLEKQLKRTSFELLEKNRLIDELEKRKFDTEALLMESHSSAKKMAEGAALQCQVRNREMVERTHFIIALQMKLLTTKEEVDELKKKLEESSQEKNQLLDRFKQISLNYDNQRRESMKLTEKLEHQKDNIQKAEEMKMKFRQIQFSNQKLKVEKEEAVKELEELKRWTEALKARYDIVEEDRKQTQESHEITVADFSDLRDRADELELRLTISAREINDFKKRCKDLEQTANTYREQRDLYEKAWKDTSAEREQLRKDREDTAAQLTEVIRSRDEAINRQMEYSRQFEGQLKKTTEELRTVRERLYHTELEMEDLRKAKLQRNPSDVDDDNPFAEKVAKRNGIKLLLDTGKVKEAKLEGRVDAEEDSPGNSSEDSFDWKLRRSTSKVIESVKKRVAPKRCPAVDRADGAEEDDASSSTTLHGRSEKSLSLDEKLGELCPEVKSLSLETQKCLSIDRNRSLFKSPPTYTTLEYMFGSSVSNTASALYNPFDCNSSLYSSFRSSDSGFPSRPSRNLSDSAKSSLGFSTSLESDTFEPAANVDDPKVDEKPKDSDKCRGKSQSHESPTRPPYFKSISSPSKIMNFVTSKVSLGSRASEERSSLKDENETDGPGEQTRRKFKDAARNPSNKGISKLPANSLFLSTDDAEKEHERVQREMKEVAEALMSPTLKQPFRERSGAVTSEERARSSSAPSSPRFDFKSPEVDVQSSTSD